MNLIDPADIEFNSTGFAPLASQLHYVTEFTRLFREKLECAAWEAVFGKTSQPDGDLKITNFEVNRDNSVSFGLSREIYCRGESETVYYFEHAGSPVMPADIVAKGFAAWAGFIEFWLEKDKAMGAEKAAAKKLKEDEERQGIKTDEQGRKYVWRWVPTRVNKDNMRCLMLPQQGRYTWATKAEVDAYITAIVTSEHNNVAQLTQLYGVLAEIKPRQCKCYPGHFDPMAVFFYD